MDFLVTQTDPRWIEVALSDLDATLIDHAHCEKKAAATALKLIADYPDQAQMVRKLAKLAQEELRHFFSVMAVLAKRGLPLTRDPGDPYAQALLAEVRSHEPHRQLDRLLVCALIEARSCERLTLLGEALPAGSLQDLYRRLATAEAGHRHLFVELATFQFGPRLAEARLFDLAAVEARLLGTLPLAPRVH